MARQYGAILNLSILAEATVAIKGAIDHVRLGNLTGTEIQHTIARMRSHPGANISRGDFDRIAAPILVLRCARCHNEETLGLMVLKTQPVATIRRMAAPPGSGVRQDQVPAVVQAFETLISQ